MTNPLERLRERLVNFAIKTVLDSGFHAVGSGLQVMNLRFQSLNSKAQDSGFHETKFLNSRFDKQKFPGF